MSRNFGHQPRADVITNDRIATCFALGFIVIIGIVLIGGFWAASSLLG